MSKLIESIQNSRILTVGFDSIIMDSRTNEPAKRSTIAKVANCTPVNISKCLVRIKQGYILPTYAINNLSQDHLFYLKWINHSRSIVEANKRVHKAASLGFKQYPDNSVHCMSAAELFIFKDFFGLLPEPLTQQQYSNFFKKTALIASKKQYKAHCINRLTNPIGE